MDYKKEIIISIHVPAWGPTQSCQSKAGTVFHFNPRSRVGNDGQKVYTTDIVVISIHVPAWGTTSEKLGVIQSKLFQSTFPRGERRTSWMLR